MTPTWRKSVWDGQGTVQVFKFELDDQLIHRVHHDFESAREAKQARVQTASATTLLKSLRQRGVVISNPLPVFDPDDVVGLVGEILAKDILIQRGYDQVFAKFEATGTSKSRGIDLIFRRFDRTWELRLVEAKHLHQAVRGKDKSASPPQLRSKFIDGLDGFEGEDTILNLAYVLDRLYWTRYSAKGAGVGTADLDNKISFLTSKMSTAEYTLEVVASIDSAYCDADTLELATGTITRRDAIGPHETCLSSLEADGLEAFTLEACRKYA